MAGADQGPEVPQAPGETGGCRPGAGSNWAGLLPELLVKVAGTLVGQTEAVWVAQLREGGWSEEEVREMMAKRKRDGNCLFVFARVCKEWRKAQLKVGPRCAPGWSPT